MEQKAQDQNPFGVGDVVQLKSGGLDMTVHCVDASDSTGSNVYCTWYSPETTTYERIELNHRLLTLRDVN